MNYTVISDPLDTRRRSSLEKTFEQVGIEKLIYTDAIMATRMSDKEVYSYAVSDTFLTKGEVGCVLSHKKVYEEFLDSQHNSIIIFEDDAVFTEKCSVSILQDIMKIVDNINRPVVVALQKSDYQKKEKVTITADIAMHPCHKFYCTHGYIINRAAAKNILELQTPIRFEIDAFEYYYWLGATDLYCLNNDLVVQSQDFESVIGDERFAPGVTWKKRMARREEIYKAIYANLTFLEKLKAEIKHFKRVFYERKQRFLTKR